jgi:AraC-like DNA-binding protein
MTYHTYAPSEALSAFIKCYWTLESSGAPMEKQRIVPDGCMEMIFHYGDLYRQYTDESNSIVQPRCFVFGQITHPLDIEPTGETGIFAVRFYPFGFEPFSTITMSLLANKATPLNEIFEEAGRQLEKEVLSATTTEARIDLCEHFFLKLLSEQHTVQRTVALCVDAMLKVNGSLSVKEISSRLDINRRQLERLFSEKIGLSPKQLSKIVRLQSALKLMLNEENTRLTSVAYDTDYYDQAHFNKDFKEFTGLTPKKFFSENLKMSGLFYGEN